VLAQASPRTTLLYVHDVGGAHLAAMQGPTLGGVAAPSDFVAAEIGSLGGDAVTVPPIVARANYHVPTSRRVVLFVNPIPQKGLDTALGLARARPDVRFVFVHSWAIDRAARREVNAEARRLRNVELRRGSTEPTEVYRDARLLLMPSAYPEAWGRVASEAQASGIPVIASAAAGLPEAVGDGGLLVDSRDGFDAWLRALSLLWDDSTAYAHFAARAELHGRRPDITAEAVGDRFEALLRRAGCRASFASERNSRRPDK
jgi:glycosyltransferase involved in cell wall biosynthesis